MKLRKERIEWLLSLIIHRDMKEIDNQFYELLPVKNHIEAGTESSTNHPCNVDWRLYDSLKPTNTFSAKAGV